MLGGQPPSMMAMFWTAAPGGALAEVVEPRDEQRVRPVAAAEDAQFEQVGVVQRLGLEPLRRFRAAATTRTAPSGG
jgi:hypothetical protein